MSQNSHQGPQNAPQGHCVNDVEYDWPTENPMQAWRNGQHDWLALFAFIAFCGDDGVPRMPHAKAQLKRAGVITADGRLGWRGQLLRAIVLAVVSPRARDWGLDDRRGFERAAYRQVLADDLACQCDDCKAVRSRHA